jgi:arylsulfatase A-like enzyme
VSSVDLLPTVCDYADVPAPAQVSGKSVRPLVENLEAEWRDHAYIESNYWGRAVIGERYKYVTEYIPVEDEDFVPPSGDNRERGREQLFDLETDPFETKNLAGDIAMTDVVGRMRAELKRIEGTIRRRKITEHGPQRTIARWGEKLLEYWKTQALS